MNICRSFRHEEIVYESRDCPLCALLDTHNEELDRLQDAFVGKLDKLQDERDYFHSLLSEHNPELLI